MKPRICADDNPKIILRRYRWDHEIVEISLCETHQKDPDFLFHISEEKNLMIRSAIVPKEHGDRPCRVATQDRVEFQTPYYPYDCVMESGRDIVRSVIPVVMTGITLFYLKLKKELENASKLKLSSLNSQSKEIDVFVRE